MGDEEGSSVVARPENVDTETRGNIIAEILTRHPIYVQSPVVKSFKIVLNLKINRLIDQQPRLFLE